MFWFFWMFASLAAGGENRGSAQQISSHHPIKVVATFSVIADLVKQVGGEGVTIHTLVGWGEDAHAYRPKPADIRRLVEAELLVSNGLGFEGWLSRLVLSSDYQGVTLVASKGVDAIKLEDEENHHTEEGEIHHLQFDPHAWLSISAVKIYVRNILSVLVDLDPDHQARYEHNTQQFLKKLNRFDASARTQLEAIPQFKRQFVVPHNAFAYLAREYGFQIMSLQGDSPEGQSSAAQIAHAIRKIKKHNYQLVFSENVANNRMIMQVKNETKAEFAGELISGALSNELAPTYLKMMEYNVSLIAQALGPE